MSEYINIDIALNNLDSNKYGVKLNQEEVKDRFEEVYIYLDNQPTVDVVPVVHAHWISDPDYPSHTICSNCKNWINMYQLLNYCPNCGAKMDERVSK